MDWVTIKLICHVQCTFVRIASTTETCLGNKLICHVQCTFVRMAFTTETCLGNKPGNRNKGKGNDTGLA